MSRTVAAAFAALFVVSAVFADGDFSKPDKQGNLPEGTAESGVARTFRLDADKPNPLSCDTKYFFRAVTHAGGVTCQGFDFAGLYGQASDAAFKRADETHCKEGPDSQCKSAKTWRAWHSWDCQNGNADVVVVVAKACPKTPATFVEAPKVKRPKAAELRAPNPQNPATQPGTTEDIDVTGGPGKHGCTLPNVVAKYIYRYARAAQPASFEADVRDAERLARAYNDSIQCAAGCKHQDYKAEKIQWSYDGTHVVVEVWFIPCKKPE